MRICLYTETALPMVGGQELVIDALARQFLARGHEVHGAGPAAAGKAKPDGEHVAALSGGSASPLLFHAPFFGFLSEGI